MSMYNDKAGLKRVAPYEEVRGSGLNRMLGWPARVLICVLAVLVFLGMSNPMQTAALGRASLAGLGLTGDGLEDLTAAEEQMSGAVNALATAAAKLETSGNGLTAAGTEMTTAKNALKDARTAVNGAQAALDATLGAEIAACEAVVAEGGAANAVAGAQAVAEVLKPVVAAQESLALSSGDAEAAANLYTATENALYTLWDPALIPAEGADLANNVATVLSEPLWVADYTDPAWAEAMAPAIAAADAMVAEAVTAAEAEMAAGAEALAAAEKQLANYGTALPDTQAAVTAALAALDAADAAVKDAQTAQRNAAKPNATDEVKAGAETATATAVAALAAADEAMDACAVQLRAAEGPSAIAGTTLALGQADGLRLYANVFMLAVLVGLVGMVMSLGNNRMRRIGLPVIAGGAVLAAVMLVLALGVHGQIAENVETLRAAYGATPMAEAMTAAIDKLALDVPDALWVSLAVAVLAALFAAAAWLTLPKAVEQQMQIDLLTIFQRLTRILIAVTGMMVFFPALNPGRVSTLINENASLFTVATSYGTIVEKMEFALSRGVIESGVIIMLMIGSAVVMLGIILNAAGACMSLGNNRMKKKGGYLLPMAGSALILTGLIVIFYVYNMLLQKTIADPNVLRYLQPMLPGGIVFWGVSAVLVFMSSFVSWYLLPDELEEKMEMDEKYRNFLMFLPVLLLTFIFCYLPIYGWRFAFFDYKIGDQMLLYDTVVDGVVTQESNYVGLKWFTYLFENPANRDDLVRVLRNTLIMSGLGIATSWLPIAFAVLLAEVRSSKFQRIVQTLTTIPNFISWVLVYAIAFAIFSTDGFINSFLRNVMGVAGANTDYLASADWIWVKMLLWGTWKGLGWSAIVYIAGIAGIDQQLYEAARVDGANRFQCIRHITIPGLIPTYMVMLLMSVAGMLSNGMDQYLVFENAINKDVIEVLDLYVYNIGIKSGLIPLSTVVGVFKSLIGVTLLFGANGISKAVRGESII